MSTLRLLPFAAVLLAGGCVTDYAYHQGNPAGGDYYSGTPRVEYRYHTPSGIYRSYSPYVDPGIYGYGWYGWYRGGASPGPYGIYGNPYWGAPYWGPPAYHYRRIDYPYGNPYGPRPRTVHPRYDGSPWRNIDRIGHRPPPPGVVPPGTPPPGAGIQQPPPPPPPPAPPPRYETPRPPSPAVTPYERARARGKTVDQGSD